jgi:hypothetical protein
MLIYVYYRHKPVPPLLAELAELAEQATNPAVLAEQATNPPLPLMVKGPLMGQREGSLPLMGRILRLLVYKREACLSLACPPQQGK